jgi:hypothetical protein
MNFIKVGNIFINLREIESFEVYGTPSDVSVRFIYRSGRQETAHINIENDDPSQIVDIDYAEDMVAEGILTAIQNCADADCEDVADYVEE